jgi:hypothetical protein
MRKYNELSVNVKNNFKNLMYIPDTGQMLFINSIKNVRSSASFNLAYMYAISTLKTTKYY